MFERTKIVHALDHVVTVIGGCWFTLQKCLSFTEVPLGKYEGFSQMRYHIVFFFCLSYSVSWTFECVQKKDLFIEIGCRQLLHSRLHE
jgi:hypothetical protein